MVLCDAICWSGNYFPLRTDFLGKEFIPFSKVFRPGLKHPETAVEVQGTQSPAVPSAGSLPDLGL